MKTVYHFFRAKTEHHVPKYIKNFNYFHKKKGSKVKFVLFEYKKKYDIVYDQIELNENIKLIRLRSWGQVFLFFIKNFMNKEAIFILHGYNYSYFIINFLLPFKRNKVYWVCWGDGLNNHRGVKGVLFGIVKRLLYNSVGKINTLMTPDKESLVKKFHYNKTVVTIPYFNKTVQLNPDETNRYFDDKSVNILVGNNIAVYNRHVKWLEELRKFKNEDIRIIVFAGYGAAPDDYKQKVKGLGEEFFGNRFYFIDSLLDMETFKSVMKSVDVLIIDTAFQNGLGTINTCAFYGGNIFLAEGGSNEAWLKNRGMLSYSTRIIQNAQKISELLLLNSQQKDMNFRVICEHRKSVPEYEAKWYNFLYM